MDKEPVSLFDLPHYMNDDRWNVVEQFLLSESKLPGPRANLSLAAAFADYFEFVNLTDVKEDQLQTWLSITATDAPTGDPREFLPFCAVQALGAAYSIASDRERVKLLEWIKRAANDERWRVREAVSIALQRIGESSFVALQQIIEDWLPTANLLEMRAIVTGLAHTPLLRTAENALYSLTVADRIVESIQLLPAAERKTEAFQVLKKGLGFAPSLFIAALPDEGFEMLSRWSQSGDRDIEWIVHENLKKDRLSKLQADRAL